jgi:LysM repeat protein
VFVEYRFFNSDIDTMTSPRAFILLLVMMLIPLLAAAQTGDRIHTVRAGETLFSISREYNITVDELRRWNNLRDNTIMTGQRLVVSAPQASPATPSRPDTRATDRPQEPVTAEPRRHTVRAGETLFAISRRYQVEVNDLRRANNLQSDALRVGQVLIIPAEPGPGQARTATPAPGTETRPVQPADTQRTTQTETTPPPATVPPATVPPTATPPATAPPARAQEERERSLVIETREGSAYYTVRPGDTLYRIAARHNMTLAELRGLNNLRGDVISVGQQLLVRSGSTAAAIGSETASGFGRFASYTVQRGDNLEDLLQRFYMDRIDFESLNPGVNPDRLVNGQTITVLEPPVARQANPYRMAVDAGDSDLTPVTRYGEAHKGRTTTNGELYNPDHLTAAHATLPLGSVVFVQNPETGRGIFILINDRIVDESIRLSESAWTALDYAGSSRQAAVIVPGR